MSQNFRLNPFCRNLLRPALGFSLPALLPALALAGPSGGAVIAGDVNIANPDAFTTLVTQNSAAAVVNWQQFNVGAQELVQFVQPSASAAILNRIVGGSPSAILGNLSANGRVFLVNPQGVMFSKTATVDVGSLFAGTTDIRDQDFLSGRYVFTDAGNVGRIENHGVIRASDGGFVVLAGPEVVNTGTVQARQGTAALVVGDGLTLQLADDGLVRVEVSGPALSQAAGVRNSGQVLADGGRAVLSARVSDLAATAVNNSGLVRATGLVERNGQILLEGLGGDVVHGGVVDASSTARSGGQVAVLSDENIHLQAGSVIAANGTDGGVIHAIAAQNLAMDAGSLVEARPLVAGGKGGFAELSGYQGLQFNGTTRLGPGGTLLLDPSNVRLTLNAGNCSFDTACFSADQVVGAMMDGTNVALIASQNVLVDLSGTSLVSDSSGSLLIGIGSPETPAGNVFIGQTGLPGDYADFQRGNEGGSINFVNANDSISVGGDLRVENATAGSGFVRVANLSAGGDLVVLNGTSDGIELIGANYSAGNALSIYNENAGGITASGNGAISFASGGGLTIADAPLSGTVTPAGNLTISRTDAASIRSAGGDIRLGNVSVQSSQPLTIQSANGNVSAQTIQSFGTATICAGLSDGCNGRTSTEASGSVSLNALQATEIRLEAVGNISAGSLSTEFVQGPGSGDIIVRNFAAPDGTPGNTNLPFVRSSGGIAIVSENANVGAISLIYGRALADSNFGPGVNLNADAQGASAFIQTGAEATVRLSSELGFDGNSAVAGAVLLNVGQLNTDAIVSGTDITINAQRGIRGIEGGLVLNAQNRAEIAAGLASNSETGPVNGDVLIASASASELLVSSLSGDITLLAAPEGVSNLQLCAGVVASDFGCGIGTAGFGGHSVNLQNLSLTANRIELAATADILAGDLSAGFGGLSLQQYAGAFNSPGVLNQVATGNLSSSQFVVVQAKNANITAGSIFAGGTARVIATGSGADVTIAEVDAQQQALVQAAGDVTIAGAVRVTDPKFDSARDVGGEFAAPSEPVATPIRSGFTVESRVIAGGDISVGDSETAFDVSNSQGAARLEVRSSGGSITANGASFVVGAVNEGLQRFANPDQPSSSDLFAQTNMAEATFSAAPFVAGDPAQQVPDQFGDITLNGEVVVASVNPVAFRADTQDNSRSLEVANSLLSVQAGGSISVAGPMAVVGHGDAVARILAGPQGTISLQAGPSSYFDANARNAITVQSDGAAYTYSDTNGAQVERVLGTAMLEIGQAQNSGDAPVDIPSDALRVLINGPVAVAGPNAVAQLSAGQLFINGVANPEIAALEVRAHTDNADDGRVASTVVRDGNDSEVLNIRGGTAAARVRVSGAGDDPYSEPIDPTCDADCEQAIESDVSLRILGDVRVQAAAGQLRIEGRNAAGAETTDRLIIDGNVTVVSPEQFSQVGNMFSPDPSGDALRATFKNGVLPVARLTPSVGATHQNLSLTPVSIAGEAVMSIGTLPTVSSGDSAPTPPAPQFAGDVQIAGSLTITAAGLANATVQAKNLSVDGDVLVVSDPNQRAQLLGQLVVDQSVALSSFACVESDCADFATAPAQSGSAQVERFVHAVGDQTTAAQFSSAKLDVRGERGDPSAGLSVGGSVNVSGTTGLFTADTGAVDIAGGVAINTIEGAGTGLDYAETITFSPSGFQFQEGSGGLPNGEVLGVASVSSTQLLGGVHGLRLRAGDIRIGGDTSVFGRGLTALQLVADQTLSVAGRVSLTGEGLDSPVYFSDDPSAGFVQGPSFFVTEEQDEGGNVITSFSLAGYFSNGASVQSQTVLSLSGGSIEGGTQAENAQILGGVSATASGELVLAGVRATVTGDFVATANGLEGQLGLLSEQFVADGFDLIPSAPNALAGVEAINYGEQVDPATGLNTATGQGRNDVRVLRNANTATGGSLVLAADQLGDIDQSRYTAQGALAVQLTGNGSATQVFTGLELSGETVLVENLNIGTVEAPSIGAIRLRATGPADSEIGRSMLVNDSSFQVGSFSAIAESGDLLMDGGTIATAASALPDINLEAQAGRVDLGKVSLSTSGGGNVNVAGSNGVSVDAESMIDSGASVALTSSGGSVSVQGSSVTASDSLELTASTVDVSSSSLGASAVLINAGSAALVNSTLSAGLTSINAGAVAIVSSGVEAGSLTISAIDASLLGSDVNAGDVTVLADSLRIEESALSMVRGTLDATQVDVIASSLAFEDALRIRSGEGDVTIGNGSSLTGNGALTITGGGLRIENSGVDVGSLTTDIDGDTSIVRTGGPAMTIAADNFNFRSGGDWTLRQIALQQGESQPLPPPNPALLILSGSGDVTASTIGVFSATIQSGALALDADADLNIVSSALTGSGITSLTAGNGTVESSSVTAARFEANSREATRLTNATVSANSLSVASGAITSIVETQLALQQAGAISGNGVVVIDSTLNYNLAAPSLAPTGLAVNSGTAALQLQASQLSANGGNLIATGASAAISASTVDLGSGNLDLQTGALSVTASGITGNSLQVNGTGSVTVSASELAGNAVSLTSLTNLVIDGSTVAGARTLRGATSSTIVNSSISGAEATTIGAAGSQVRIESSNVTVDSGALEIQGGALRLASSTLAATSIAANISGDTAVSASSLGANLLSLDSANRFTATDSSFVGGGRIAGGNTTVLVGSDLTAGSALQIGTGASSLTIDDTELSVDGSTLTFAGGSLQILMSEQTADALSANISGDITVAEGSILTANRLNLISGAALSAEGVTLNGGGAVSGRNSTSLSTTTVTANSPLIIGTNGSVVRLANSTIDVDGAGLELVGGSLLVSGGSADAGSIATTVAGDIRLANAAVLSAGALNIISGAALSAEGVTLNGGGTVVGNTSTTLDTVRATATSPLVIGSTSGATALSNTQIAAPTAAVTLSGNGLMIGGGQINAGSLIANSAAGTSVNGAAINAGNVSLTSVGGTQVSTSSIVGGGAITGGTLTLSNSNWTASAPIALTASSGALQVTSTTLAGSSVNLNGNGVELTDANINGAAVQALSASAVSSTGGSIQTQNLLIDAAGVLTLDALRLTSNTGSTAILRGENLVVTGNSTLASSSLTFDAAQNLQLTQFQLDPSTQQFSLLAGGTLSVLDSTLRGLGTIGGETIAFSDSSFNLQAGSTVAARAALSIDSSSVFSDDAGAIRLSAGSVAVRGSSLGSSGGLQIASAGDLLMRDSSLFGNTSLAADDGVQLLSTFASGSVQVEAERIEITNSQFQLSAPSSFNSGESGVAIRASELFSFDPIAVAITGGRVSLADSQLELGRLDITSGSTLALTDNTRIAVQTGSLLSGEDVLIEDSSVVFATPRTQDGDSTLRAADTAPTNTLQVQAQGNLTLSNAEVNGFRTVIQRETSAAVVSNEQNAAASIAVRLDSGGALTITDGSRVHSPDIAIRSEQSLRIDGDSLISTRAPAASPAASAALRKQVSANGIVQLAGSTVTLGPAQVIGGDVAIDAGTGLLEFAGGAVDGEAVTLNAAQIDTSAASRLNALSLISRAARQNFTLTNLTLGDASNGETGDQALLALINAVRPDLVPSAGPNASFIAAEQLRLGAVGGTARYIEAISADAQFTAPVRGASNLFLNLRPVSDQQGFEVSNLDFARDQLATFVLGSGTYNGVITVTDPNLAQPVNAGPRLSITDTPTTDFVFVYQQNVVEPPPPLSPNAEVILLSEEFEPEDTFAKKKRLANDEDENGAGVVSPIRIERLYASEAEAQCSIEGGAL